MKKNREYKRGWKADKDMNKTLDSINNILNKTNLPQLKQIKEFNKITGKSRSSFFRYKRFLRDESCYKRNKTPKHSSSKEYKKELIPQLIKESYGVVGFACNHWMKRTGQSRSSFFRLRREIKRERF